MIPFAETFTLEEKDHEALWRLNALSHVRRKLQPFSLIVLGIAVALLAFGESWLHPLGFGLLFGFAMLFAIVVVQYFIFLPRSSARVFRESAYLHGPQTISLDEEGFVIEGLSGEGRHAWADIAKWDETREVMAVYPNRLIAFILPKEKLTPALIDHVRTQLVGSGLNRKGKLRK